MDITDNDAQDRYLKEMAVRLVYAGVTVGTPKDNSLPIEYDGAYLCRVSGKGEVFYRESDVKSKSRSAALHRVIDMASEVSEYKIDDHEDELNNKYQYSSQKM